MVIGDELNKKTRLVQQEDEACGSAVPPQFIGLVSWCHGLGYSTPSDDLTIDYPTLSVADHHQPAR